MDHMQLKKQDLYGNRDHHLNYPRTSGVFHISSWAVAVVKAGLVQTYTADLLGCISHKVAIHAKDILPCVLYTDRRVFEVRGREVAVS